jgi:hypothetical protein
MRVAGLVEALNVETFSDFNLCGNALTGLSIFLILSYGHALHFFTEASRNRCLGMHDTLRRSVEYVVYRTDIVSPRLYLANIDTFHSKFFIAFI